MTGTRWNGAQLALLLVLVLAFGTATADPNDLTIIAPDPGVRAGRMETSPSVRDLPFEPYVIWPSDGEADRGLALWITPNAPVGPQTSGAREISGWLGFGLIWRW